MANFVKHEACPECGSRDNLARYDDGGAFCFGCKYYEPPTEYKPSNMLGQKTVDPPSDLVPELPPANQHWLQQYLTPEEIATHFTYSPSMRRHVFKERAQDQWYWEARSVIERDDGTFTSISPKTISHGKKPLLMLGKWKSTGKVVLVEDIVSAIKVARHAGAVPLFGCVVSDKLLVFLSRLHSIKEVVLWLDYNKTWEAHQFVQKISRFKSCRVISTEKDPKENADSDIQLLLDVA